MKLLFSTLDKVADGNSMMCCTRQAKEGLEILFTALKTIKPTSVEAERAFSALGYFANKIRSQMNDATLDALIFQRQYYKK